MLSVKALATTLALLLVTASVSAGDPPSAKMKLILRGGACTAQPAAPPKTHDITFTLTRTGAGWEPDAYAFAPDYNLAFHGGTLAATESDGTLRLKASLTINRDLPSTHKDVRLVVSDRTGEAGTAEYQIQLHSAGERWEGDFAGTFNGQKLTGKALGTMTSLPALVPGYVPLAPDEHPRLFFRKSDLPLLRQRAKTEQGQKMLAVIRHQLQLGKEGKAGQYEQGEVAMGHAFLYALDGDKAEAEQARHWALRALAANGGEWGAGANAMRVLGAATAYDLCFDAWDEATKSQIRRVLLDDAFGRGNSVDLTFDAMFQASNGMAALAILGDSVPAPAKPVAPDAAPLIAAPTDFTPGKGVPINAFENGGGLAEWLVAGEFERTEPNDDPLVAIGGAAKARPEAGTKVSFGKTEGVFTPRKTGTGQSWLYNFHGPQPLKERSDQGPATYCYFYGVLDNDKPRAVEVVPNARLAQFGPPRQTLECRLWLAGQELRDGQVVRLEAGRYPVMLEVALRGQMFMAPRFYEYTAAEHQKDLAQWQEDTRVWEAAGKTMPYATQRLRKMTTFLRLYTQLAVGDRGFVGENSGFPDSWTCIAPFLHAYRTAQGVDLAEGTGLKWVVPLVIDTQARYWNADWGPNYWQSFAFPSLLPPEYRGVWRYIFDQNPGQAMCQSNHAIYALLAYPWDTDPVAPKDAKLPLVIEDRKAGGFVFRSGRGPDDFVTVVSLRDTEQRHSVSAGDFTIYGRRPWSSRWLGATDTGSGVWWYPALDQVERPNVVRIDGAIPLGGAKLTHYESRPDGSAILTCVKDRWGQQRKYEGRREGPHWGPQIGDNADLGIAHLRSMAVDYSGKSGAPAMFVLVDRVTGAGERKVYEQLNFSAHKGGPGSSLTLDANTFTLTPAARGGQAPAKVTLRSTVVSPAQPEMKHPGRNADVFHIGGGDAYFLVMTIQEGQPPAVKVEGQGLDATVIIGGQTIRFDGKTIVLSPSAP